MTTETEHWESQALNWIEWARRPMFDAYWYYRERFFDLLPAPDGPTLDVGCGEGRVTRDLAERGYDVTGVEPTPTLFAAARDAHPEGTYVQAKAAELPFEDNSVRLLVSYNTLMDFDDIDAALAEFHRVVAPGGRVALCITHPVADSAGFESRDPGAPFVIDGSYLATSPFSGEATRDGITMHFSGWHRSIGTYTRAIEGSGLLIDAIREPLPADDADPARWDRWRRVPMFMHVRCLKI
ncbi:class I SAM-dependent methyltransferase [Kibdelosporangium lantanae]